jgi:glyoxylase-like metal-dependent hydrolase (beta-lactamase superfamily II)
VKQVFSHSTQTPEGLKEYVSVLPSVRANFFELDPHLGCAVKDVGGGVFVVSDNMWQSAFLVTDGGVVVFDASETFGKSIPSAIARVTDKPIKTLIYSHIHRDHIEGS